MLFLFLLSHGQALAYAQHAAVTVQACNVMQAAPSSNTAASDIILKRVLRIQNQRQAFSNNPHSQLPCKTARYFERADKQCFPKRKAYCLSCFVHTFSSDIQFWETYSKERHSVMLQALTASELRSRLCFW